MTTPVKLPSLMLALLLGCAVAAPPQDQPALTADQERTLQIVKDVRRELVTLNEYGVFDHLTFGLKNGTVILRGFASRPTLKSAAQSVVKRIKYVEQVDNQIEVLPLSPNDDRIRASVYARIYGHPSLQRYTANRPAGRFITPAQVATGITNNPPLGFHAIHIIVKHGNVTLFGFVDTEGDYAIAEMQARSTPGTFSVFNELEVAGKDK